MQIVAAINKALSGLFSLLLYPFESLSPLWPLLLISALSGILMLWIFGKVSNQSAIKQRKNRMQGSIIGIRIYRDDLRQLFRFQASILGDLLVYLKHAVIPLLIILIPVIPILAQLNLRFASGPIPPGEPTILTATVRDSATLDEGIRLESSAAIDIETSGVRIPGLREVSWRIRPRTAGVHMIRLVTPGESIEKEIVVGAGWGAISTRRTGRNAWDNLLYPGESPITRESAVQSITVRHPDLDLSILGWRAHWLVVFIVASILAGYAFRNRLGVQI